MRGRNRAVAGALALAAATIVAPGSVSAAPSGDVAVQAEATWWGNLRGSSLAGTNKVLDIEGVSTADGARVQLWVLNNGANQMFFHDSIGSSLYKLRNRNSNKCLDLAGPSDADGTQVHQWNCYNSNSQVWLKQRVGTRSLNGRTVTVFRYVNQYGRKTCLDNAGGSGNNGNKIQVWTCNGGDAQLWF